MKEQELKHSRSHTSDVS